MSVNSFKPHAWIIAEDRANLQLVNGFQNHHSINTQAIGLRRPAGGWTHVLDEFEAEFVGHLRSYKTAHVILLIDFDEFGESRRAICENRIPADVKSRVFLIGSRNNPEDLRREPKRSLEQIGTELAEDGSRAEFDKWSHPHLAHNLPELQRMIPVIKPIIFQGA